MSAALDYAERLAASMGGAICTEAHGDDAAVRWSSCSGRVDAPAWDVEVGGYCAVAPTPRAALLKALDRLAAAADSTAAESRDEAKRARLPGRKAYATKAAEAAAKRAADVRALAERVAAMWPEVTP